MSLTFDWVIVLLYKEDVEGVIPTKFRTKLEVDEVGVYAPDPSSKISEDKDMES